MFLIDNYQGKKLSLQKKIVVGICFIFQLVGQENTIDSINEVKTPLKILIVVSFFPPQSGTAVLNQITGLIDRGHDVYVYATKRGQLELCHPDVDKYDLLNRVYFNSNIQNKKKEKLTNLPPDLETFDIIYCQFGYRGNEFLAIKEERQLKAKLVTCFRGADLSKHVKINPHKYDLLLQKGDLFLPVCEAFKKRLISLGADSEKVIVHHSAVNCKKFSFKPRRLAPGETVKIVTVCRLIEKKGLVYAIQAVERLIQKNKKIKYDIIGFGPMEKDLEKLVKRLGMQDHINLVGRASEDEVAMMLDNAHIFLLPSATATNGDEEGIPNALKEAMARGMPVISTFHSGIPELVEDGVSGFLVPERNSVMITQKLKYLVANPDIWYEMGKAGHATVNRYYEKEAVNNRLIAVFDRLMKEN